MGIDCVVATSGGTGACIASGIGDAGGVQRDDVGGVGGAGGLESHVFAIDKLAVCLGIGNLRFLIFKTLVFLYKYFL